MKRTLLTASAAAIIITFCLVLSPLGLTYDGNDTAKSVTFSKDVAPIFYKNCVDCHRPGELAPMSLLSYKDARPWARSIREKVVAREMPPWSADPHFGTFSNDRRLSQKEVDTISAWVDQGAKEGNASDLPPQPDFASGWKSGKPDLVLTMAEEYAIAPEGSDEYINFSLPTNFKEDRWIRGVEIHPGNKKVVHHVVAFIQSPQMAARYKSPGRGSFAGQSIFFSDGTRKRVKADAPVFDDGCAAPNGGFARGSGEEGLGLLLGFYAPGKDTDTWPAGTAKLIPAGSNIIIQVHYSKTTGKAEKDRSSVGLYYADGPPEKSLMSFGALNHYFKIPAGDSNHEVTACYTFSRDVQLLTLMPHMHLRGKDMKYEGIYPDGRRETLLFVPRYNFNWQSMYRMQTPLEIPKGTKLLVTAHFDNSERNKYNPDPSKTVRFGDPTYDEMMIGYFDFVSKNARPVAAKIDPALYDACAGQYQVGGVPFTVSKQGNKLFMTAMGQPSFELFPESEKSFLVKEFDGLVTFVKNDKGEVVELILETNGRSVHAKKTTQPAG
jgi:hypothetical protein